MLKPFSLKNSFFFLACLAISAFGVISINAQSQKVESDKKSKETKKQEKPVAFDPKNPTAEQVGETVIFAYGGLGGREGLKQIRKTSIERGKVTVPDESGAQQQLSYEKRIMRGDSLDKERIRYDQESPSAKYALIYNDNKIIGIFNESVFTPSEEALKAFQNQMWHGIEALLRYKENGATLALNGREKYMGAEYHILDLTDKENRKTRFFVSTKTYRVMWLEYTEGNVKYIRKFYDYRPAQGTLVPYRTILTADGKQIEETQILTVTFGQKVDEGTFQSGE